MNKILIIGARGFVGRNLINSFNNPAKLKLMVRNKDFVPFSGDYEIVQADLTKIETLDHVLDGVDTIYYLAHGMDQKEPFDKIEALQANNLAHYLKPEHKLIYLSGLGDDNLSIHLQSRQNVGNIFRKSPARIIELRASIVIGNGSTSFELIRAIVERFPIILNADWSNTLCQPIALENLLTILVQCHDIHSEENVIYPIGENEQLRYVDLLIKYAKLRNLKRPVVKIKDFPISIVEEIMQIFLNEYYEVGRKLLGSIEIPTTINEMNHPFQTKKITIDQAIQDAINKYDTKKETVTFTSKQSITLDEKLIKKLIPICIQIYKLNPLSFFKIMTIDSFNDELRIKLLESLKMDIMINPRELSIMGKFIPQNFLGKLITHTHVGSILSKLRKK
jgi:uncharacterized protein YbjT (DUF2867 family)